MAIQITGDAVEAPPVYDRIFIVKVVIESRRDRDDARPDTVKYQVDYQLYGVGGDGNRHYQDRIRTENFKDEGEGLVDLQAAIANALTGNNKIDTAVVV